MTKEEILAKSRADNKTRDEMEQSVFYKSGQTACAVGAAVCGLIMILEGVVKDNTRFDLWAVFLAMTGTMLVMKYKKLKKIYELIFGAAELVIAAVFLGIYIYRLFQG